MFGHVDVAVIFVNQGCGDAFLQHLYSPLK